MPSQPVVHKYFPALNAYKAKAVRATRKSVKDSTLHEAGNNQGERYSWPPPEFKCSRKTGLIAKEVVARVAVQFEERFEETLSDVFNKMYQIDYDRIINGKEPTSEQLALLEKAKEQLKKAAIGTSSPGYEVSGLTFESAITQYFNLRSEIHDTQTFKERKSMGEIFVLAEKAQENLRIAAMVEWRKERPRQINLMPLKHR